MDKYIDQFTVIENTRKAKDEYGHHYGSNEITISVEDIAALFKGKALAWDDGEYTTFVVLDKKELKQVCGSKEWDTCRVEKLGCPGCFYEPKENKLVVPISEINRLKNLAVEQEKQLDSNIERIKQNEIDNIKTEHKIMKRIIINHGLLETLLNDEEFIKHLNKE